MEKLKSIRQRNKMTQKQLAEKMGIHISHIRKYEKENIFPSLHYWNRFKIIFNVTDDEMKDKPLIRLEEQR